VRIYYSRGDKTVAPGDMTYLWTVHNAASDQGGSDRVEPGTMTPACAWRVVLQPDAAYECLAVEQLLGDVR